MPQDGTEQPQPDASDAAPKAGPLSWVRKFDHGVDLVKGLSVFTLLSSVVVGYFQYLGAYQDKVSNQAKEDMASAAATFTEISGAFSEILALQRILYTDFTNAVKAKSDGSDQALGTKNAHEISEAYEKARTTLRQNIDVLARKAEVYVDWASDIYRDPAGKHNVDDDPLSRSVLHEYAFDCSDKSTLPGFGDVDAPDDQTVRDIRDEDYCASNNKRVVDDTTSPQNAFLRLCPKNNNKQATRIYWYSAKHHVVTMHYCFEAVHDRLTPVRQWASKSDRDKAKEGELLKETSRIDAEMDDLSRRLSAFNSLALYQMERIRVKYRPVGFICSVPLVRNIPSMSCFPLRTATNTTH
jgi:hypothetical protein